MQVFSMQDLPPCVSKQLRAKGKDTMVTLTRLREEQENLKRINAP